MNIESEIGVSPDIKSEQAEKTKKLFERAEAAITTHQENPKAAKLESLLKTAKDLNQEIESATDSRPVQDFTREISGGQDAGTGLHDINDICAAIENLSSELEQA